MNIAYILGLIALWIGERIIGGDSNTHWLFSSAGFALLLLSTFQNFKNNSSRYPAIFSGLSILGALSLLMSGTNVQSFFSIDEKNLLQWEAFWMGLGSLFLLCSIIPSMALSRLIALGQHHASSAKIQKQAWLWLGTSFALASIAPINYIAHDSNYRWELGYFKTAQPGESTLNLTSNLSEPITVYLFFRMGMDVTDEVRSYFDLLPTDNLEIAYVDKDLEPALAKELNIRDNGTIALVRGEGSTQKIERINVGKTLSSAKRILKKLDEEFRESLLKISKDPTTLYFTTGHGELYWKVEDGDDPARNISLLKRGLTSSNFVLKELNISNGLANEIPEDTSAVVILAPQMEFADAEIQSLVNYWQNGHPIFVALEADSAGLQPLLNELNVQMHPTFLGHSNIYMPSTKRQVLTDRYNLVTNKFSTHASVTTLSRYNKVMQLRFFNTGYLTPLENSEIKTTSIIKSLEETWVDHNQNYTFDPDEPKDIWSLAMAVEQTSQDQDKDQEQNAIERKAIVFADATWLTDDFLAQGFTIGKQTIQPHAVMLSDTLFWLTNQKDSTGSVNNEQDVKIQHSKEGQGWLFFGTSILIPLAFLGLGFLRIKNRNKGVEQ